LRRGDTFGVTLDVKQLLAAEPNNAPALVLRAQACMEMAHVQWALADLNKAVRLDPKLPNARHQRGLLYLLRGQPAEAQADFDKAIQLEPEVAKHYLQRGIAQMRRNAPDDALNDLNKAIELDENLALAFVKRGDLLMDAKDEAGAMEDYDIAVDLAPNDPAARVQRGEARRKKKYHQDSLADFNKAIELNPRMPEAFKGRGLTRLDQERTQYRDPNSVDVARYNEARQDFIEAVRLRPAWKEDLERELKSITYLYALKAPDLKTTLNTAPEKPLSEAEAFFNQGRTMLMMGRGRMEETAKARLRMARKLDPKKFKEKVDALIGPEENEATSPGEKPSPTKPRVFPGRRPRE
jgi:tetratricopeptide (TPR) repeat protein